MKQLKFLSGYKPISINLMLIPRLVIGGLFIYYGRELFNAKQVHEFSGYLSNELHFPFPLLMSYLHSGSMFFGGIMVLLGLFTRLGSGLICFTMLVGFIAADKGDFTGHAFVLATYSLVILLMGAGNYSLDYLLFKKRHSTL